MGKYSAISKLSKTEQQELFIDFATALASIRNPIEAANFVKDLLSEGEVIMLARRLQIAGLLIDGLTYDQIEKEMKVSNTTIAKVHTWLNLYGEGYRTILERRRTKPKSDSLNPLSFSRLKKKYPMYFWPELVLKEIVKNSNLKQRRKLEAVLAGMKEKTKLSRDLEQILKSAKHYNTQ